MIDENPQFAGTGDYHFDCGTPCINAGDTDASIIGADVFNLDGDTNTSEPTVDLDLNDERVVGGVVDLGCYELQPIACLADINDDGAVDVTDLLAVIGAWGSCPSPPTACPADVGPGPCESDADGVVDNTDLQLVIAQWGDCPGGDSLTSGGGGGLSEEDAATFRACVEAAIDLELEGQEFVDYVVDCLCEAGLIECDE